MGRSAALPGSRAAGPKTCPLRLLPAGLLAAPLLAVPAPLGSQLLEMPGPNDPASAQYVHRAWTVEDGLPVNYPNWLLQGRNGYLWLTTFDGLVRFDGVRFRVFNTAHSPGLPTNRVLELVEDDDGSLWFLTEGNRAVHMHDGAFTVVPTEDPVGRGLERTPEGEIWILTRTELGRGKPDSTFEVEYRFPAEVDVADLYGTASGEFWISTWDGRLACYREGGITWFGPDDGLSVGWIHDLHRSPDGRIWVAGDEGLRVRAPGADRFEPIRGPDGRTWTRRTWSFIPPAEGSGLLIRTDSAIWSHGEEGFERYLQGAVSQNSPDAHLRARDGALWVARDERLYRDRRLVFEAPDRILRLLEDREGGIWVASDGLHRLRRSSFTVLGEPEGLVRNVYSIAQQSDGTLWFGTLRHGLASLRGGRVRVYGEGRGLFSNLPFSVYVDRDDGLWVGFWRGGTCAFDGVECRRPTGIEGLETSTVRAIYHDSRGDHWFGTDEGLYRRRGERWKRYGLADGLPTDAIRVVKEGADGALWIGTYGGGIVRMSGDRIESLDTSHGLSHDLIRSIYVDGDGVVWVGTEGRGLNRVFVSPGDPLSAARITAYTTEAGLFSDVVHQIVEDDVGRLWMSSNQGIFWADREDLEAFARGDADEVHVVSYTERDGLRNREANGGVQSPAIEDGEGRIWFSMIDGVAVVDPSRVRRNEVAPPVVIESVVTEEREIDPLARTGIDLEPEERELEIRYTGLSLLAPETVRFRYRLEGFDRDWVSAGARRVAFYTNVPPGTYTFRVVASNHDGVWNEEGAALRLSVTPFFYETGWFVAAIVGLVGIAGLAGLRWRDRHTRARAERLEALVTERTDELLRQRETVARQAEHLRELDEAKSRFFANISHEFRTPLTLTIGPLEDLREGLRGDLSPDAVESLELALRNSRRLLALVDELLAVARLEAGEIRLQARRGDIAAFLRQMGREYAHLAERKRIEVRFDLPSEPVPLWFDPQLLEKVIGNLLSNALKFTPEGGKVRLALMHSRVADTGAAPSVEAEAEGSAPGIVIVEVRDSGPGIPAGEIPKIFRRFYRYRTDDGPVEPGTGIGLSLAKELAELHGGGIEVESEAGFGAVFRVTLPRGRDHLEPEEIADDGEDRVPGWLEPASPPSPRRPELAPADRTTPSPRGAPANERRGDGPRHRSPLDDADVTTVLVVDDDPDLRAYVRDHLASAYRVLEAGDGGEALELARDRTPDLVISDLMMPVLDGHGLVQALKEDRRTDYIPVILLTAKASPEEKLEGLGEGADDFVTKPFDMAELEARVENLISSRRRLRTRYRSERVLRPERVEVPSADAAFLESVRAVIEDNLHDEEFSVDDLASVLGRSRSNLYRRLREVHDDPPAEVIKSMRLERAAQLLEADFGSVGKVAYSCGFKSVSHFSRCFKERFGAPPSEYPPAVP